MTKRLFFILLSFSCCLVIALSGCSIISERETFSEITHGLDTQVVSFEENDDESRYTELTHSTFSSPHGQMGNMRYTTWVALDADGNRLFCLQEGITGEIRISFYDRYDEAHYHVNLV